jgi:hypothetical protein
MGAVMLRSAATAAWCSLLCVLAALNKLRWSLAAQHCRIGSRQSPGSANSKEASSSLANLYSSNTGKQQCKLYSAGGCHQP